MSGDSDAFGHVALSGMDALLLGSRIFALCLEVGGIFVLATFFSLACGIGAYVKAHVPGKWMIAGFLLGPLAFAILLFQGDD